MLKALLTLFICLAIGDAINKLSGFPLPGAVIGLLILLAILVIRRGADQPLKLASDFLLQNLTLLFVPASLGIITQLATLKQDAWPIGVAIVVSTVLGMAVTALIMRWLAPRALDSDEDIAAEQE